MVLSAAASLVDAAALFFMGFDLYDICIKIVQILASMLCSR